MIPTKSEQQEKQTEQDTTNMNFFNDFDIYFIKQKWKK